MAAMRCALWASASWSVKPELHPHAFRHGCGVELLRRSGGNLRALQEHLRIHTTTIYTRLTPADLQKVVSTFARSGN